MDEFSRILAAARRRAAVCCLPALLLVCSASFAAGEAPEVRHQGAIRYLNGGIGHSEASQLMSQADRYPLSLTFVSRVGGKGAYTTGVDVSILSDDGAPVFRTQSQGPLMLLDLPAGRYIVEARLGGETIDREVEVGGGGHRKLVFEWNQGAEPERRLYPDDMTVKLPKRL